MRQFRLVHVGVAAVLGAATVAAVGLVQSVTAASGSASSFVPITPCRLVDTRPGSDHVGARATAIGANEAVTFAVWGTNGNCTIPNTATGIATNTTAVNPTAGSFLTVYPADANPRPTASNLNFVAGSPPTPNQVTVGLSAAGAIDVYNLAGTVDVIVDIVGYYQRVSAVGGPSGDQSMFIDGAGFTPVLNMYVYNVQAGGLSSTNHACFTKSLNIPNGATVTLLSGVVSDLSVTQGADLELHGTDLSGFSEVMTQFGTGQLEAPGKVSGGNNSISHPVINNASKGYSLEFCGDTNVSFLSAAIDYTLP